MIAFGLSVQFSFSQSLALCDRNGVFTWFVCRRPSRMPAYNATVDNVSTWDEAHPAYIDLCVASVLAIALRSLTITYNLPTNCSIGFLMNYDVGTSSSHASDVVLRNIHFHICAGSDPSHVSNIALGAPGGD